MAGATGAAAAVAAGLFAASVELLAAKATVRAAVVDVVVVVVISASDGEGLEAGAGKEEEREEADGACQEPVGPAALRPKVPPTRTCTSSPTAAWL